MIYGDEPQQIGEYEDPLGTSRYVYAPQITAVMQAGNLYGYGLENPIRHFDPSGEIAITTIILIGSAVVGLIAAGVEAHQSKKYTGKIDWVNTITTGISWFALAYTLGMSAYGIYVSYCNYKGIEPVSEINFNANATVDSGNNMRIHYTISQKIARQIERRNWSRAEIDATIQNPFTTRTAINKATSGAATAYYTQAGDYIVVDNLTGEIIQISEKGNSAWIPDSSINNPYRP